MKANARRLAAGACALAGVFLTMAAVAAEHVFASPGKALKFQVTTGESLRFALDLNGQRVIRPSALGFAFRNEPAMQANFELVEPPTVAEGLVDEWTPVVRNKHAHVRLDYNEAVLKLRESKGEGRRMDLTVRLYEGGVAFRYTLYGRNRPEERLIVDELTEYRVPDTSFAWVAWQNGDYANSQETDFNRWAVTSIPSDKWCFSPLLVEVDKSHFLALTSAHLDDYPGFFTTWRDGALKTRLAPTVAEGPSGVKARFDRRFDTPWRVILAGDNPGKFIESEIVRSLNPPCAIADTSWIRPGLSAWDHWWSGDVKMEMSAIKEYIDLAAQQGWPYMLVDWQWYGPFNRPSADITKWSKKIDLPALIRYAKERNVRLWLWLYCADANRNDAYVEAFKLYRQWGIAGVKIDFMDRYDREAVNWYRRMTAAAAENHLLIDFHGAFAPDGLDRTYPNQVTREGVMGEEFCKFSKRITPKHNVTLCFTRMLAGAMDYTPGGFLNVTPDKFRPQKPTLVMNTRAAELAKFVLYESPVAFVSDHPRHILGQPGADFLKIVPTEWDDTRFLGGAPAEWIALAKKSGDRWFVAVMGGDDAREVELDLSPLGAGPNLQYWADGEEPSKPVCGTATCADGRLKVKLAPGGGYVAVVTKSPAAAAREDFHAWAPTPPMGWNSWDCYGSMVDEAAYRANADWLAARLLKFGYDYCVIDIRWTVANETSAYYNQKNPRYTLDAFGRYLPAANRFPSAADGKGFRPLADYAHAKGLKFGIHIMRGVPKEAVARKLPVKGCPGVTCDMITDGRIECPWLRDNCTVVKGRRGAQEYYNSILELYASWGVDFIKCDDLSYPYHADEIEMLRAAIDACGRKIVLSTSPGETPLVKSEHVAKHANMWRMVGDLWDSWHAVNRLTDVAAKWVGQPSVPGSWADCDMIPLGRLCVRGYRGARNARLSKDEARYLMTLMCIVRSPLMIGSDLPSLENDPETLALLTDAELLAVHRAGGKVRCDRCTPEECVIVSETPDGRLHVALFNRSDARRTVRGAGAEAELAPHSAAVRVVRGER